MEFDPVTVDITPSNPQLPDIVPSRYSVCGHIIITVHPKIPFKVINYCIAIKLVNWYVCLEQILYC